MFTHSKLSIDTYKGGIMPKRVLLFLGVLFVLPAVNVFSETITVTTYYPSPYGVYEELRAKKVAIGDSYFDATTHAWDDGVGLIAANEIEQNADLVIEGNVGIGTYQPQNLLHLSGSMTVDAGAWGEGINFNQHWDSDASATINLNGRDSYAIWADPINDILIFEASPAVAAGSTVTPNVAIVIEDTGNVGIGTDEPIADLHINGNITRGGLLLASGTNMVNLGDSTSSVLASTATISGGFSNSNSGNTATIAGGARNSVSSRGGFIGGGYENIVTGGNSTVAAGWSNEVNGYSAFVGAGYNNTANGDYSVVAGGDNNYVYSSGEYAGINGGQQNFISGDLSFIGGGYRNRVYGNNSMVGSGTYNRLYNDNSVISGGAYNYINASGASIGGGRYNQATAINATVSGGTTNYATNACSTVGGGYYNVASGAYSTIAGGYSNKADTWYATSIGGRDNDAEGSYSTVTGGYGNEASGDFSVIAGGRLNTATKDYSFAAGLNAHAEHENAFVWNGNSTSTHNSYAADSFNVRADYVRFTSSKGHFTINGTSIATSSDERLKKEIEPLDNSLERVIALRGVNYKWREPSYASDNNMNKLELGLIAQEVKKVVPEVVEKDTNDFYVVRYDRLVALLIEAIKEQQDQIDNLKKEIK